MTKPDIRVADDEDWTAIQSMQAKYAESIPFEVSFPGREEADWLVADFGHGPVTALGVRDQERERQLMLVWNPGRYESFGAAALMRAVEARSAGLRLWFLTQANLPDHVLRTFNRWGYAKLAGNEQMTVYGKEID